MHDAQPLQELIAARVASGDLQLPVFNPVALKLQEALNRDDIGIDEIEAMIVEDQALASEILRMANSPFFKGLNEITTINRAIIRLGAQQVANLAMVVSQRSTYCTKNKLLNQYMEKLWHQAFASALGSQWVAQRGGNATLANVAFLAGLLHDIGKLVILRVIDEISAANAASLTLTDTVIAEILDSSMHTEQGHLLMKQWNLPEEYCLVARDHHNETHDTKNILLVIVRLVDQACTKLGIGMHADSDMVLAASAEAQILGLTEIQLAELEIELEDSLNI